ncbi:hypothetical protein B0H19DRAFT_840924, partial [Mycena capillaripes]
LNISKCVVYNRIMQVTTVENPPPLHIDGRAGRGKTYVLYPVIGALRKLNEIVQYLKKPFKSSSAFAAKNYPGGQTAHTSY